MHKSVYRNLSQQLLLVVAVIASAGVYAEKLVNPEVVSGGWLMPPRAINASQIPQMQLDPKAPDDKPLPVYQLADNTYFLYGNIATLDANNRGWNGNAGFIVTDAGVVVIDSLGTPRLGKRFIATIRSLTDKPIRYLVITHNHPDHAYGAAPFMAMKGVKVIAHEGIIDYNHSETLTTSVAYRRELLGKDMSDFKPIKADITIDSSPFSMKEIKLGNETFRIYNTGKHHSHGDLVVHQVKQNILWVSDLVFNQRTTYMGDGSSKQILQAHAWLKKTFTDITLMVPGHGSAQTPPFKMLTMTNEYVQRMRSTMKKAVENGASLYDAVKQVEFENWKSLRLYEQNQRANANFVYREMEKEYFDNF